MYNLTEEQKARLLAGRDEAMAEVDRRVAGIRRARRRRTVALTTTAVLALGVGTLLFVPKGQPTLVAEHRAPAAIAVTADTAIAATTVETVQAEVQPEKPAVERNAPKAVKTHRITEPVVMCNNQCDADSVISDIWKFLSA